MARQYSPKSVLRHVPNALLRQYLTEKGIGADLPWKHLAENNIEPIYSAIEAAEERVRRVVDWDFQRICEMADEGGVKILIEEARDPHHDGGLDLTGKAKEVRNHLEFAFWVFLEHPKVFEVASHFHRADNLPGRSWRKRADLPPVEAATDKESCKRLEEAISAYYRRKEGRGHACKVDHWRRDNRLYWFAHPEDYPEGRLIYDEQHELKSETQRPAFDVIFVYCQEEGSLDLYVHGEKETVLDLQRIFGRAILGVELPDPEATGVVYELQRLLDRNVQLPLEPEDGVEEARVRRLRLRIMESQHGNRNRLRRLTLEAGAKDDREAVYDLLDDVLAGERIPREVLMVQHAGLQLVFRPDERGRRRTLSFDVSHPDSCSLKYEPRHLVAKGLLKRWGLDVSGRAENGPPKRRRSVQHVIRT
jgi:hypothetical protein